MARILVLLIFIFAFTVSASQEPKGQIPIPAHVPREPFVPQKFDLGVVLGNAWSSSSYVLIGGFLGYDTFSCGATCRAYIEADERVVAQRGQTHYLSSLGVRFQNFKEGSPWGPYLKLFGGIQHYIFSGTTQDFGYGGLAVGGYLFLHPAADLRVEAAGSVGPVSFIFLSIGASIKWKNI